MPSFGPTPGFMKPVAPGRAAPANPAFNRSQGSRASGSLVPADVLPEGGLGHQKQTPGLPPGVCNTRQWKPDIIARQPGQAPKSGRNTKT